MTSPHEPPSQAAVSKSSARCGTLSQAGIFLRPARIPATTLAAELNHQTPKIYDEVVFARSGDDDKTVINRLAPTKPLVLDAKVRQLPEVGVRWEV